MSTRSMISTTLPLETDLSPTDLLLATPVEIIKLTNNIKPIITISTNFIDLLLWQSDSFASLILLFAWWTLCLSTRMVLLYGVNGVIIAYILFKYSSSHKNSTSITPSTQIKLTPQAHAQLLQATSKLTTQLQLINSTILIPIQANFSLVPNEHKVTPAYQSARLALTSYPFYLLLTYFVPLNFIILVLGTILILWNAPAFQLLRSLLYKSAAIRWITRIVFAILNGGKGFESQLQLTKSGLGVPGLFSSTPKKAIVSEQNVKTESSTELEGGDDVQIEFTIMENQRWWVGLDWTHALLPGERASWTDPSLNPSLPPSSFTLPPPTITFTPSPTRSAPKSKLKKITEWKWLDSEWLILRSTPLNGTGTNFPFPATQAQYPASPPSPPLDPYGPKISSPSSSPVKTRSNTLPGNGVAENNTAWVVDVEGWQYGDNHFEKMGAKGGLGKYTRRRAWTRRAGLIERCERVD